eukprot:jgi/Chlat1/1809/Chrsp135S02127
MAEERRAAEKEDDKVEGMDKEGAGGGGSTGRVVLYPDSDGRVSAWWAAKYEREAARNWDLFYKRHDARFFRDRHYLHREFPALLLNDNNINNNNRTFTLLEVGCGAGNTVFPLLEYYNSNNNNNDNNNNNNNNIFIYACDFSPRAVGLVRANSLYDEARMRAFVCDVTLEDASDERCVMNNVPEGSIDVATAVFVLSAIAPERMPAAEGGSVLVRDYAEGDLAQERLHAKEQKINEHFYVRGDGTRAYYFSEEFLQSLFEKEGFACDEMITHERDLENRARNLTMHRRWIQAVFRRVGADVNERFEDVSSASLFAQDPQYERVEVSVCGRVASVECVQGEHQHTQANTGLLLWPGATALAAFIHKHPQIFANKDVIELGCGGAGVCAMSLSAVGARSVLATDGDVDTLELLRKNLAHNVESIPTIELIKTQRLRWDHPDDISDINIKLFDIIVGADVVYSESNLPKLFRTAAALISTTNNPHARLILCHLFRHGNEHAVRCAAGDVGFECQTVSFRHALANGIDNEGGDVVSTAASVGACGGEGEVEYQFSNALHIMVFCRRQT